VKIKRTALMAVLEQQMRDGADEGEDAASWSMEEGILLTRREARFVVEELHRLEGLEK
jgi:hypothetical protein